MRIDAYETIILPFFSPCLIIIFFSVFCSFIGHGSFIMTRDHWGPGSLALPRNQTIVTYTLLEVRLCKSSNNKNFKNDQTFKTFKYSSPSLRWKKNVCSPSKRTFTQFLEKRFRVECRLDPTYREATNVCTIAPFFLADRKALFWSFWQLISFKNPERQVAMIVCVVVPFNLQKFEIRGTG